MRALLEWSEEICIATALGFAIGIAYWHLHRGFGYSFTFVQTCVVTVVLTSIIARTVSIAASNSTALAFALIGMLGLIRFRTVVRDTREFVFLFLAITAGIVVGSGNSLAGVAGCVVALALLYALGKTEFGATNTCAFRIKIRGGSSIVNSVESELTDVAESIVLISAKLDAESEYSYAFDVVTNGKLSPNFLLSRLLGADPKLKVTITRHNRSRGNNDHDDD